MFSVARGTLVTSITLPYDEGEITVSPAWVIYDFIALQVNEVTKLLTKGVVKSPADIDSTMINGGGGIGPFQVGQTMGYAELAKICDSLAQRFNVSVFKPTRC